MTILLSITPTLNQRIGTNSSFTAVFSSDLSELTINKQNIIFERANVPLKYDISWVNTSANTIVITPSKILSVNTVYDLTFTSGIKDDVANGITQITLNFITETEESYNNTVADTLLDNRNDVYNMSYEIKDLLDIDYLYGPSGDEFNYSYNPTEYDPLTKTYSKNTNVKLEFDIQKLVKEKFRNQYLIDYDVYFKNIRELNTLSDAEFNDLEQFLFTNSFELATSSGLKTKIETMLKYYGLALDKHFIEVQPDPLEPFVYHITTNIDIEHWNLTLKQLLHPIGWQELYRELPKVTYMGVELSEFTVNVQTNYLSLNLVDNLVEDYQEVTLGSSMTLPAPLNSSLPHYILNWTESTKTFQITNSKVLNIEGTAYIYGDPLDLTDMGSGVHYVNIDGVTHEFSIDTAANSITLEKNSLTDGENVHLDTKDVNSVLPSGLEKNVEYFVVNSNASGDQFQLSLIKGGTAVDIYDFPTGTVHLKRFKYNQTELFQWSFAYLTSKFLAENSIESTLRVLQDFKWISKFAFNYSQAGDLGILQDDSRFFDDGNGVGIIHFPESINDFTEADTTFKFASDNHSSYEHPVVTVESDQFLTSDFNFGYINLENNKKTLDAVVDPVTYTVNSPSLIGGETNYYTVQLQAGQDIIDMANFAVGSLLSFYTTGTRILQQGSIDVIPFMEVAYFDYSTNEIRVYNPDPTNYVITGANEIKWKTEEIVNIVTFYVPGLFSFDLQLWNGFARIANLKYIDPKDLKRKDKFNINYSKYGAVQTFPLAEDGAFITEMSANALFDKVRNTDKFDNGLRVRVITTGTLPAGLAVDTDYWVINGENDTGMFQLEATESSGTPVTITDDGTGIHSFVDETQSWVEEQFRTEFSSNKFHTKRYVEYSYAGDLNVDWEVGSNVYRFDTIDDVRSGITNGFYGTVEYHDVVAKLIIFRHSHLGDVIGSGVEKLSNWYFINQKKINPSTDNVTAKALVDKGSIFTRTNTYKTKFDLSYNYPQFDSYLWTETLDNLGTGGEAHDVRSITNDNRFTMFINGANNYSVDLKLNWHKLLEISGVPSLSFLEDAETAFVDESDPITLSSTGNLPYDLAVGDTFDDVTSYVIYNYNSADNTFQIATVAAPTTALTFQNNGDGFHSVHDVNNTYPLIAYPATDTFLLKPHGSLNRNTGDWATDGYTIGSTLLVEDSILNNNFFEVVGFEDYLTVANRKLVLKNLQTIKDELIVAPGLALNDETSGISARKDTTDLMNPSTTIMDFESQDSVGGTDFHITMLLDDAFGVIDDLYQMKDTYLSYDADWIAYGESDIFTDTDIYMNKKIINVSTDVIAPTENTTLYNISTDLTSVTINTATYLQFTMTDDFADSTGEISGRVKFYDNTDNPVAGLVNFYVYKFDYGNKTITIYNDDAGSYDLTDSVKLSFISPDKKDPIFYNDRYDFFAFDVALWNGHNFIGSPARHDKTVVNGNLNRYDFSNVIIDYEDDAVTYNFVKDVSIEFYDYTESDTIRILIYNHNDFNIREGLVEKEEIYLNYTIQGEFDAMVAAIEDIQLDSTSIFSLSIKETVQSHYVSLTYSKLLTLTDLGDLTFEESSRSLTRSTGTWSGDLAEEDNTRIRVINSVSNDGAYRIVTLSSGTAVLELATPIVDETLTGIETITSKDPSEYTIIDVGGWTGGTGLIG